MKKKSLFILAILSISALSATLFTSCDKDTWCYLDITVVDARTNSIPTDTTYVKVQYVKHNDTDPNNDVVGTIADTGMCDERGTYQTRFAAPAIFTITARINEPDTLNHKFYFREGEKSIRLKEGETVTATVKVTGDKTLGRADFQPI